MILNSKYNKKDIIFNYMSPINEILAKTLSIFKFNVFYLKLKNYNKDKTFIKNKIDNLSTKNINPLPIQDLKKLTFTSEARSDPDKLSYTLALKLNDKKIITKLIKLLPEIKNFDEKLIFILQSKIFKLNRDNVFYLKNWLENNPNKKIYYIHFGLDGFLLEGIDSKIKKIILPNEFFLLLKKVIYFSFKKFFNIFLKKKKNNSHEKDINGDSEQKLGVVIHDMEYAVKGLMKKDFYYSKDKNSPFFQKKMLHFSYRDVDHPGKNLKWVNLKKKKFSIKKTSLFILEYLKILFFIRNIKSLKLFIFYLPYFIKIFVYSEIISKFKNLKFVLIDYDLLCPTNLLLAFERCQIKTVATQERPITTFYFSRNFLPLDTYLVASDYIKKEIEKSPIYMIDQCLAVGQYRTDYLHYHKKQKPVKIITDAQNEKKKIIVALGYHTECNKSAGTTDPLLNWKSTKFFLDDMLKLSENLENAFIILRYKLLDWMHLEYFSESINKIKSKKNICFYDVYEDQDTYKICSHSNLIIAQPSSIADECMAFGLPVLFHVYSHNLIKDKAQFFDYNKNNLCYDFQELLNKAQDCLKDSEFLNSLLANNKRVYDSISDGRVKQRSQKILENMLRSN